MGGVAGIGVLHGLIVHVHGVGVGVDTGCIWVVARLVAVVIVLLLIATGLSAVVSGLVAIVVVLHLLLVVSLGLGRGAVALGLLARWGLGIALLGLATLLIGILGAAAARLLVVG